MVPEALHEVRVWFPVNAEFDHNWYRSQQGSPFRLVVGFSRPGDLVSTSLP